jgi:hypothetical protein
MCLVFFVAVLVLYFQLLLRAIARSETFGEWFLVFACAILMYLAYLAFNGITAKRLAPDAGLKTSIDSYRAYFEWERRHGLHVFAAYCTILTGAAIAAVRLWSLAAEFPARYALQFGLAYVLIGIVTFLGWKYKSRQLQREFDMLDALEKDQPS